MTKTILAWLGGLAILVVCNGAFATPAKVIVPESVRRDLHYMESAVCEIRNAMYGYSVQWDKSDRAYVEKNGVFKRWVAVHDDLMRAEQKLRALLKDMGDE